MGLLSKLDAKQKETGELEQRLAAASLYDPENPPWWWSLDQSDEDNQRNDEETKFFDWLNGAFYSATVHYNARAVLRRYWKETGLEGIK